jgi:hypothetical protein
MKIVDIARTCHEANRALCASMGDHSQQPWDEAPQWQQDSAIIGVQVVVKNPAVTPEQLHQSWLDQKAADGWRYGEVKDADAKTHPCFVPYAQLPQTQQAKDAIFGAIVRSLLPLLES